MSNVEVISPDGQAGTIPQESLAAALQDGFKQAARVTNPDGVEGSLPIENLDAALKDGYKLKSDTAPAAASQTGFDSPAVQTLVGVAKAVGHVGQTYGVAYTNLVRGALSGIANTVTDWYGEQN